MAVDVKMPQLGESVHEGTIGKWLKAEGDSVEKGQVLLELWNDDLRAELLLARRDGDDGEPPTRH